MTFIGKLTRSWPINLDPTKVTADLAALPDSFYTILGVLLISNLGVIVTVIGAAFRLVYKFAVLETKVKALHRRQDDLEGRRYPTDNGEDQH